MSKRWVKPTLIIVTIIIVIIALYFKSVQPPAGIKDTLKVISASIEKTDEKGFLSLVDEHNPEFYAEERHLFQDIARNKLQDFRMTAKGARKLGDTGYIVKVLQSFKQGGERKSIKFEGVFRRYGEGYKFSDLYFQSIEKEHFIIRYQPSLKKEANRLAGFVDEVYGNVKNIYGKAPEDKTIIKLYDNNEVFNAFIKPSIKFRMAGWYEYPESIKINMSTKLIKLLPDAAFREQYFTVLSHELTHRINSMESNNNIPYWLAEGIATYVEDKGKPDLDKDSRHIAELEKINLEELTDTGEIDAYYRDSYINTSLLLNRYGLEGLHEILSQLGNYPLEESTQGVVYMESNRRFHEVVRKLYNVDLEQFDNEIRR